MGGTGGATPGVVSISHGGDGQLHGEGKKSPFAEGNEEFYSVNRTKSISLVSNMGWMETNTREKKSALSGNGFGRRR